MSPVATEKRSDYLPLRDVAKAQTIALALARGETVSDSDLDSLPTEWVQQHLQAAVRTAVDRMEANRDFAVARQAKADLAQLQAAEHKAKADLIAITAQYNEAIAPYADAHQTAVEAVRVKRGESARLNSEAFSMLDRTLDRETRRKIEENGRAITAREERLSQLVMRREQRYSLEGRLSTLKDQPRDPDPMKAAAQRVEIAQCKTALAKFDDVEKEIKSLRSQLETLDAEKRTLDAARLEPINVRLSGVVGDDAPRDLYSFGG